MPVGPGFVPGPMQQGAADAAKQRPVKRPVTIQAPPDSQQTAAPFPPPQVPLLALNEQPPWIL